MGKLIEEKYKQWIERDQERKRIIEKISTEVDSAFINIYGMQSDIQVYNREPASTNYDPRQQIIALISYAVGCMFGRYSLDEEGIVYAGGKWNPSRYITFPADSDGIIPICDDEYFNDDILNYFIKFIKVAYGDDTTEQNIAYVAKCLGGKGTPREIIRSYFLNNFFADHCAMYSINGSGKRPIYWLFDSGKNNGFKCLIYIHRYQPDTIARIRTDYVHEQQSRYRTAIEELEQRVTSGTTSEKVKINKRLKKLRDQSDELHAYEEKIHHLADQYISLNLDEGIKVNYAKLQDVLAKI